MKSFRLVVQKYSKPKKDSGKLPTTLQKRKLTVLKTCPTLTKEWEVGLRKILPKPPLLLIWACKLRRKSTRMQIQMPSKSRHFPISRLLAQQEEQSLPVPELKRKTHSLKRERRKMFSTRSPKKLLSHQFPRLLLDRILKPPQKQQRTLIYKIKTHTI